MDDFHKGEIKNWLENYNGDDEDDENDSPFFPDVSSDEDSDSDIDVDDDKLDEYYKKNNNGKSIFSNKNLNVGNVNWTD